METAPLKKKFIMILVTASLSGTSPALTRWQKLHGCRLAEGALREADVLPVVHEGQAYRFRLYFVDAAESAPESRTLAEQAEYWGIPESRVPRIGRAAIEFVRKTLEPGFAVLTQWERVGGPTATTAVYYALVEIEGHQLAELLVEEGLARIHGASTPLPDGTSLDTFLQRLRQAEARAKSRKRGVWQPVTAAQPDISVAPEPEPAPPSQWPNVPTVAFLRGEAYINTERFEEAEEAMRGLLKRFPDHPQKPRIEFYLGLSLAMQERFEEAEKLFREWLNRYPQHVLRSEVAFWLPIALFYGGRHAEARPLFEKFASQHPMSVYAPEAAYRAALCRYAVEDFAGAAQALEEWVRRYPDHYFRWEALVTLGDALAAIGELERAKKAYLSVGKQGGAFQFMALKQAARVFKALGTHDDYAAMAEAFAQYIRENPDSENVIDAAYQAGWALRQIGRIEDARRLYWSMIELHGNSMLWEGFDDLLDDLQRLYPSDPERYRAELKAQLERARQQKRVTLVGRLTMADIRARPTAEQDAAAVALMSALPLNQLGLETLVWWGEVLNRYGKPIEASSCFERVLALAPNSRYAVPARVRLAQFHLKRNRPEEALAHADAVVSNPADPVLLMEATFCRARALQALGRYSEAVTDYNTVLANRVTPRALKPEALLQLALCMEAQGRPRQAIPYYQRIYVLYGAYTSLVAQAYLRSGLAFEQLADFEAAARTYRELLEKENLAQTAEAAEARKRLEKLNL